MNGRAFSQKPCKRGRSTATSYMVLSKEELTLVMLLFPEENRRLKHVEYIGLFKEESMNLDYIALSKGEWTSAKCWLHWSIQRRMNIYKLFAI